MVSLSTPLSLYAIPLMWIITYYPAYAKSALIKRVAGFNNVQPRGNPARLEKKGVPPEILARLQRIEGAHNNGLESLPFFGLAVLAGNYAGMDTASLNVASGLYLVWRVIYNYIYFNQSSQKTAGLRTITWASSMLFPFYIYIKSASLVIAKAALSDGTVRIQ
ncbi:hypothetical protein JR316_0008956 [Psilocybe cubensis]|uniref:Uncharacterized protein n=2 Tax=Psilocybe cubensis TaxID=181762 RepID=A0A8H8CK90_PSICU|nr:hypothetical protein JR316_0008956 [Psilocybe cubensis]KAH9478501.1 hypothetical protein JR316_0008956 [Psilocybe cubensis]